MKTLIGLMWLQKWRAGLWRLDWVSAERAAPGIMQAMKVLNLRCANGHGFEGWFASDDEFMAQNGRGLIECPLCADRIVSRLPSAPRLNLSGQRESGGAGRPRRKRRRQLQAQWMQAVRKMLDTTDDVGERFPEEARRIHYGEIEARGIRGQASARGAPCAARGRHRDHVAAHAGGAEGPAAVVAVAGSCLSATARSAHR